MKSPKQKQKLYNKFLKSRIKENEVIYKAYKNLFEAIRKKSKRNYYSELSAKYKNDVKNAWKMINEITSTKNKREDLPEKLVINNTTVVKNKKLLKILISTL